MSGLPTPERFWSRPAAELLAELGSGSGGLSAAEAQRRLAQAGPNSVAPGRELAVGRLLLRQFSSPLVLILVAGALISLFVADWIDAAAILVIVAGSALLGFWQEYRASTAIERLRNRLALTVRARRDGALVEIDARDLVPGDLIELSAGNLVPADGVIVEARDFLVIEASLTGESFPVEKAPGVASAEAPLRSRTNCVFLGSSVRSGTATVLIAATGRRTALGEVGGALAQPVPESDFARGARRFGEMLLRVMLVVVVAVMAANALLDRPVIESMLFAVALAVGLSPELLPAIVSVSLARGAGRLAGLGVMVRRLDAIEDLGGIDVLCTDKTGTLTAGTMALQAAVDADGADSAEVLRLAWLNASFETGIDNPIDAAIVAAGRDRGLAAAGAGKLDEIPYDFVRKRLTIVVSEGEGARLITKGAFAQVLAVCAAVRSGGGAAPLDDARRAQLEAFARAQGERGVRVLALASRAVAAQARYGVGDEAGLVFEGFLCFADPPRPQMTQVLHDLAARGVRVKIVTGDNRHVAAHLAGLVGLDPARMLTGEALARMHDDALRQQAPAIDLFVEVDPMQKERIVRALQGAGHAVGFLGDGINDAPALHAADVGISVDQAVDVAREAADVVLLAPDLAVLMRGVEEGRRTFVNTMKYIGITTSANFGNMVSMALATPLLPFLPLTATQILLNNLLSDLPSMALGADRVDHGSLRRARRWDVREVRRFMIGFGLVSSLFDLLTFALLIAVFKAAEPLFHSAWFVVSLLTELVVVLLLRTAAPAWRSRPSPLLLWSTVAVAVCAVLLPYLTPVAQVLGFVPIPLPLLALLLAIVLAYAAVTEALKRRLGLQA